MKNSILESHFLEQDWVKTQPEGFKTQLLESYHQSINGKIQYIDYFGTPLIYSLKDGQYYSIKNGKIIHEGHFKSENDLTRMNEKEFYEKFPTLGELKNIFLNKANIENELMFILSPEDSEKWFLSLLEKYNPEEKENILKALKICKEKHHEQYRDEGTEYYAHPIFAAIKGIEFGQESQDIIILLLHDTIEDTDLSYEDIKKQFGEYVAEGVNGLSKKEAGVTRISKEEYYKNLSQNEKLATLKGLDRLANLYSLNFATPEKKIRYLNETKHIIIPILEKYHTGLTIELKRIIDYIENDSFQFPPELKIKIRDLREIKRIHEEIAKKNI